MVMYLKRWKLWWKHGKHSLLFINGQTRRFINKVKGFDTYEISSAVAPVTMTEPFIMVIPSYESHVYGDVIETAEEF